MIYGFSNFGYEGALVMAEIDLRRGIPAVDLVGLADSAVKESRERMRSAIRNSGFEFPPERVLISLSPADLKKEGAGFDLLLALAVISESKGLKVDDVLVLGELELSGKCSPVRGVFAALSAAASAGIKHAIVPKGSEKAVPSGINVVYVDNLMEAYEALVSTCKKEPASFSGPSNEVEFEDCDDDKTFDSLRNMNWLKYAMTVAVAGGHHILAFGPPGCGKSLAMGCFPSLMPALTSEETYSTTRIHSLAGLLGGNEGLMRRRPFRQPHQTATLEGMCGGGCHVMPGEISLAHNGMLFLDEAAEFRTSVLQMLRVPVESKQVTLSRAGRSTVYPADFQLALAMTPCPCGFFGSKDRMCLCSARSVEQYWKKVSAPLVDRIGIRVDCESQKECADITLSEARKLIKLARERQLARGGVLNEKMDPAKVSEIVLDADAKALLSENTEKNDYSPRAVGEILKIAITVADMRGSDSVCGDDMLTAIRLHGELPINV